MRKVRELNKEFFAERRQALTRAVAQTARVVRDLKEFHNCEVWQLNEKFLADLTRAVCRRFGLTARDTVTVYDRAVDLLERHEKIMNMTTASYGTPVRPLPGSEHWHASSDGQPNRPIREPARRRRRRRQAIEYFWDTVSQYRDRLVLQVLLIGNKNPDNDELVRSHINKWLHSQLEAAEQADYWRGLHERAAITAANCVGAHYGLYNQ